MPTPTLAACVNEKQKPEAAELEAEITALWRRYLKLRAAPVHGKKKLAAHRLEFGRRLHRAHAMVGDHRGFSAWLRGKDIPRATAHRAMKAAAACDGNAPCQQPEAQRQGLIDRICDTVERIANSLNAKWRTN